MTNKIHNIVIINSISDFTSSYPIPKQRWILEGYIGIILSVLLAML